MSESKPTGDWASRTSGEISPFTVDEFSQLAEVGKQLCASYTSDLSKNFSPSNKEIAWVDMILSMGLEKILFGKNFVEIGREGRPNLLDLRYVRSAKDVENRIHGDEGIHVLEAQTNPQITRHLKPELSEALNQATEDLFRKLLEAAHQITDNRKLGKPLGS